MFEYSHHQLGGLCMDIIGRTTQTLITSVNLRVNTLK